MRKSKKIVIGIILLIFIVFGTFVFLKISNKKIESSSKSINKILKSGAYSYLPEEAKEYVREVYEETGKVILTEKNKEDNVAYLNPAYVNYLVNGQNSVSSDTEDNEAPGYVPPKMIMDIDYSVSSSNVSVNLPSSYDLRDVDGKSYVSPVRTQDPYELSWAFAYTGALESKIMKLKGINEIDFSERQIDYARSDPSDAIDIGVNPYTTPMENNLLTDIGNIDVFSKNILFGVSPINENGWNNDYISYDRLKPEEVWNFENVNYDVDEFNVFYRSTKNSKNDLIKLIKQKIIDNGSVATVVNYDLKLKYPVLGSGQKALKFGMLNNILFYQDENTSEFYNQAVQIIGWDDDYEYSICYSDTEIKNPILNNCSNGYTKKAIKGAWIIQNSMGELSEPYAYLAYDSSVSEFVSFNKVNNKTWDNEYNYNFTTVEKKVSTNKIEFEYKAPTKEKIQKIKFYANSSLGDTSKKFDIYLSTTGNASDYKLITSKTVQYNGLYTIDLSSKNIILNGNYKLKIALNNYSFYADEVTVFTSNVNSDKKIEISDTENTDDNYIRSLTNQDNAILLNGISRNLKISDKIDYRIYKNNTDVTNKFKFDRNYSVSNVINTIISYNSSDVQNGVYNAKAYINNTKYADFKITIKSTVAKMSGSGDSKNPFIVTNKYQLDSIRNSINYHYKLGNDIVFDDSDYEKNGAFYNGGKYFEPIGPNITFSGSIEDKLSNKYINSFEKNVDVKLDGNGKKIVNLKIYRPSEDYVGLFRGIYNENNSAYVKNLSFENANIVGRNLVGVLSGVSTLSVPINTDSSLWFEISNIKIYDSIVKGDSYVGQLTGALEFQDDTSAVTKIISLFTKDNIVVNNINVLNNNKKSRVEGNNYVGGVFGIIKSMANSKNYTEINLKDIYNFSDVVSKNGQAGGITSKTLMHSKDMVLALEDISNHGQINGKTCSAQILCEADIVNESDVYGNVSLKNAYYQTGYAYLPGKANVTSKNSISHSIKYKKEVSCSFISGNYTFSKKSKGSFTLECESDYGFDSDVMLKKLDFTFNLGILTKLFTATVESVNKVGTSSDGKKVTFRVIVKPGLFKGSTSLILTANSIKDLYGNSNKKIKSKEITITK